MPGLNENYKLRLNEPRMNEVNLDVFHEVVESMIADKDKDKDTEDLGEGFIWRAIFLYVKKIGAKVDRDELKRLHEKIKPELINILDDKKRKYKFDKMPSGIPNKKNWLTEWQEKQDEKQEIQNI